VRGIVSKMVHIKQAVILAGGQGTRLKPFTDTMPKPMIPLNNRPFLEYLVEMLKENGIEEIVFLLGYKAEKIVEHFGDGKKFGVKIKHSVGAVEDDTGTRIRNAKNLIDNHFLLMYCDNYWPMNLKKLEEFYNQNPTLASVTVFTNKKGVTKNNVIVDSEGFVVKYDKTRTEPGLNGVDIGFMIIDKKVLDMMPDTNFSFEKEILTKLVEQHQLRAYLTDHRYYSIGSIDRLEQTTKYLLPRKIIFLDRDGVINKKAPKADYVKKWSEFEFLPGVIEGLELLSKKGYELYILTNQPGIAREMMTLDDLNDIHAKMLQEFEKHNIKIIQIYSCLHGWHDGCECRKPKPGLFFDASHDHAINLGKTVFIGDDERDVTAGEAAGIKTYLVGTEKGFLQVVKEIIWNDDKTYHDKKSYDEKNHTR
jgi:histidinol-phosphate phosphatase family protein